MVATLLRLRFLVLRNSLTRSTWTIVATIIGGLYAVGVMVGVVTGLVALGIFGTTGQVSTVVVLAGSATIAGWILFPVLLTGIDQTLDTARLSQFPLPTRTLLVALTAAGVLGVPGIVTGVAALATVLAWWRHPAAAVAAPIAAVAGVLIAVVGSRAVIAASTSWRSHRRARELGTIALLIPLMLLGPIVVFAMQGLRASADALPGVAATLGWTPLGAAWAIPGALADGDVVGAAARLGIVLATLALLVVLWRAALLNAMTSTAGSTDGALGARGLGPFAVVPQTPAGAVMARCLVYWRRDPRYLQQLILIPVIPLLFWFASSATHAPFVLFAGPMIGLTLSGVLATDVSYDGTAFATHVIAGVRGVDDRTGRFAALVSFGVPVTAAIVVVTALAAQRGDLIPPLLGVSLGMLLGGLGVGSVSSARFVVPVPAAGTNPFRAPQGASITTGLKSFAVFGVTALVSIPVLALMGLTLAFRSPGLGWATLAVGLVVGSGVAAAGLRIGGAVLDRTGPSLLAQLRRMRDA